MAEGNRQSLEEILERQADKAPATDRPSSPKVSDDRPSDNGAQAEPETADAQRSHAPRAGNSGRAIAALVCGVLGVIAALLIPILGLVLAVAAIVLGVMENRAGRPSGLTRAAVIAGGIAALLSVVMFVVYASSADSGNDKKSRQERREDRRQERRENRQDNN
jgi:hypothetical protein